MAIPPISKAGTYYLWPGIQPTDGSGVLQSVLDGQTGGWWIATGWFGTPSLRWGNGFSTKAGDTVKFKYVKVDSDWVTTLEKADTSTTAKNSFDL
ncbi:hypothetical protein MMC32_000121, partial [Xylographa parallela]|nr:hypothetical protein [Xylographa parallela]